VRRIYRLLGVPCISSSFAAPSSFGEVYGGAALGVVSWVASFSGLPRAAHREARSEPPHNSRSLFIVNPYRIAQSTSRLLYENSIASLSQGFLSSIVVKHAPLGLLVVLDRSAPPIGTKTKRATIPVGKVALCRLFCCIARTFQRHGISYMLPN
jgi:hypothetical protein